MNTLNSPEECCHGIRQNEHCCMDYCSSVSYDFYLIFSTNDKYTIAPVLRNNELLPTEKNSLNTVLHE